MAARRTERLLNLVIALLHTRAFLTAERIREVVAGYDEAASDEAFKRTFERDKEDLRELGIPLETGTSPHDDEIGYRVSRRDYALPDVTFAPDEAAAVGLAARLWSSASLGAPAARAVRKLEAAGLDVVALPDGLQPRLDGGSAGVPVLATAVREGRRVRLDYRGAADPEPTPRMVEPWGVVWWRNRWYLVGHDVDRDASRVFRLSRIVGEPVVVGERGVVSVPDGVDLTALVSDVDPGGPEVTARLRVRRERAAGLRRRATRIVPGPEGWDELSVVMTDPSRLADEVLPYGADALVLSPPEARDVVIGRLRAVAGAGTR